VGFRVSEALAVSGFTREQTMQFDPPLQVMQAFRDWPAKSAAPSAPNRMTVAALANAEITLCDEYGVGARGRQRRANGFVSSNGHFWPKRVPSP
jgi:hypothetical protein